VNPNRSVQQLVSAASPLFRQIIAVLCFLVPFCQVQPARALEKATIQLKWLHHFQFAGYYAALEKGFYQEAGLDVTIVEGGPTTEVEDEVTSGRADFGVGTSALLLHRAHGEDLVVLGQIFQHSPAVFLTPRKTGIRSLADLAGRRFMYSNQHGDMLALLKKNGIDQNGIIRVPHQGDPRDLIDGKAEVMIAYSFNEPFILEQAGEPYLTFSPLSYGVDFYGDNFFTRREIIDARPEFVEAFRMATLRGWRYALANKSEMADLILSRYSKGKSREWLIFEANQMDTLIQPTLIELGYQNPSRWEHIAEIFSELRMLPEGFDPGGIIYQPRPRNNYRLLLATILISCAIIAILTASVVTFQRLNRNLRAEIAERKLAEDAFRESEERLRVIFETSQAGIIMVDPQGIISFANNRMAEMFGCPLDDVIGSRYTDHLHPLANQAGSALMRQLISGEIDFVHTERNYLRNDGSDFWGYLSGRRLETAEGELRALVGIIADITDRKTAEDDNKRIEAQMLNMQKLESLGVLAGGIAHDFNNILTGIMGNISFAQMVMESSHKAHSPLLKAEKASQRAAELACQLLTFSRGGQPIKKAFSVKTLVGESVSLVLRGTNIKGVIEIPDTIIEADEGQINQAFNNIVINAVHAMPGGGTLTIRGEKPTLNVDNRLGLAPGEYVSLTFTDEGCGISEADQKRIFDPYFTTKASGTGLGLASTHSIINRHGGLILVDSSIGKGSSFTIYLPSTVQTPVPITPEHEPSPARKKGGKVLVMDDEEMIRDLAAEMLRELGYQVQTCIDGKEAIELYRAANETGASFSAVIMDLTIPGGMGGKQAAERIIEMDPKARLVVSSGYSNDPVMAKYAEVGFCATLLKPYCTSDIERVLSQTLPAEP